MKKYVIALDQGTTSSRAVAFDRNANIIGMRSQEFKQYYPNPGWVEHDPFDILNSQLKALKALLSDYRIKPEEIDSIGVTNQRETIIVWDKDTGKPIYNAIVWQCRRTAPICEQLKKDGHEKLIREKTGLVIDAYFSGTKIKWILDNVVGARELAVKGQLIAGTVDTWLIYHLTNKKCHVTDASNASRTMLYNIIENRWDQELLSILDIPMNILPEVVENSRIIGEYQLNNVAIPISGIAGDQQAALFGQNCVSVGDAKNTYGTGCFILLNIGNQPLQSENGLLTTIAWNYKGKTTYAFEGSVFNAGSSIQWLRDEMKLIDNASESEACALKVNDTNDTYFVPAFTGLGTPYWDMYARGTIVGLTRGTNRNHLIRATLESIAFQCMDVIECMEKESGTKINYLRVDGGASANNFLMQFQADITGLEVIRPKINEITALGAAFLAGLATGFFTDIEHLKNLNEIDRKFNCNTNEFFRENRKSKWHKAIEKSKGWA
ncbi:MAG: glycerol kinase GlpK [Clostridia bacterium]|nr:glycerol kinase GlpK [Clostridia bacterium]